MKTSHNKFTSLAVVLSIVAAASAAPIPQRSSEGARANTPVSQTAPGQTGADPLAPLLAEAQQALDRNDYAAAVPLLQKIVTQKPADALPHFQLGYVYSELKRNAEAAAEYRGALQLDPKLTAAHLNLGLMLLDSDPASALAAFRRAAELLPDQARPRVLAGQALERSGKLAEAVEEYRAGASLAPGDDQIRYALARALLALGQAAQAESSFREVLARKPDTPQAELGLAEALLRQQKTANAVDVLEAYLKQAPDDRQARFERSVALQDLNRFEESLAELDRVDQATAPTAESLKLRGSIYMQENKWPEADTSLQKALAAAPNDPELHAWLGHTKMELHDYASAESELRRSLAISSAEIDALRDLAGVYYLSGQYAAAISALDLLAQRETPSALNWFFRAISCDKLDRKSEAAAAYQKFLETDQGTHPDQEFQARQRLKLLLRELSSKKRR